MVMVAITGKKPQHVHIDGSKSSKVWGNDIAHNFVKKGSRRNRLMVKWLCLKKWQRNAAHEHVMRFLVHCKTL